MTLRRSPPKETPSWWNFTAEDETFEARQPDAISRLYFPLCNEAGLLSAITPTLHGDIKTGQNHFLTLPVSAEDLHNTRSARNFWVYVEGKGPWSATGSSAAATLARAGAKSAEPCHLEAGALWHRITRENRSLGLRATLTNFVPAGREQVEIMRVELTNTGRKPLSITPTAAIPIFGRSADNLRDHRHVTSLLHRITLHASGVLVTPTMSFDERGHHPNNTVYAVLGAEGEGQTPIGSFPTVASFAGEGGNFDAPRAVFEDLDPPDLNEVELHGREAVGALRFKTRKLAPGKSVVYLVFMGIATERKEALSWLRVYGTDEKAQEALAHTRAYWKERLDQIQVQTDDKAFGRWTRWVTLQPLLRKIFGCSFLPDFDYGRGGRGWRDLWQDCLALLLFDEQAASSKQPAGTAVHGSPLAARSLLLNNFAGVRMNGTNATIIGQAPGEFIADRNNISRTWMDHGAWPWITAELYIHQTGDLGFLLEPVPYFWDQDKAKSDPAPAGTVLEHVLVQHLTAYFNVGEHGNCRLEDADWNDGLDLAHERGESVAFTAVYAGNLRSIAGALEHLRDKQNVWNMELSEELDVLLEAKASSTSLSPSAKQERLNKYRSRMADGVSGKKIHLPVDTLIQDLRAKGEALAEQVRTREWLKVPAGHAWFNGYYDNTGARVEGPSDEGLRMTLTGQVFPIMSGVATNEQVQQCFVAAKKYLQDKKLGGFRLNTDFGDAQLQLGRAFSFAYGEKENGAFFSHMVIMFANALYRRGFVEEGFEVLNSLYRMCLNKEAARIYPGIPEYFNGEGRGFYHYLTGSASWYLLTLVTQVLGIRGQWGDLVLAPKLVPEQFGASGQVMAEVGFAGKRLKVTYINRSKKPFGQTRIESVLLQGRSLPLLANSDAELLISREALAQIASPAIEITIALS
ncbi:MAG: cellobiose phosphorylase [Elusimicrobiota bacterium]|jgi:cellobiose phosphorylase